MQTMTRLAVVALALAPAAAASQLGTAYCSATPNSTGVPSEVSGSGSTSLLLNDLTLNVAGLPPGTFGYFLVSFDQDFVPNPGGSSGNLCLGGSIGRYSRDVMAATSQGTVTQNMDLGAIPQPSGLVAVDAGETVNFQLWHRDQSGAGATSNFSRGLSLLVDCEGGLLYESGVVGSRQSNHVAAGDFNGDGIDDLVVASAVIAIRDAFVHLGTGGGEFAPGVSYFLSGDEAEAVAVGDVDADGNLDFVTLGISGVARVFRGTGDGSFLTPPRLVHGFPPALSMTLVDVNGDGRDDIVAGAARTSSSIALSLTMGSFDFLSPVEYAAASPGTCDVHDMLSLDVDQDGDSDLIALREGLADSVALFVNDGTGQLTGPEVFAGGFARWGDIGDFNDDGRADIVVENTQQSSVAILLNDGSGGFEPRLLYPAIDPSTNLTDVAAVDLNGDGLVDVVAGTRQCHVSVMLNVGGQGLGAPTFSPTQGDARHIAAGDFNGDGSMDFADVSLGNSSVVVHLNRSQGSFASTRIKVGGTFERFIDVDLDGDGRRELIITSRFANELQVVGYEDASTDIEELNLVPTGFQPVALASGDFNRDQLPDVVVAADFDDRVRLHLGDGSQNLGGSSSWMVGDTPLDVAVGDLNGDGADDVVTANLNSSDVSILLSDGAAGFLPAVSLPTFDRTFTVALGDLDQDGDLDLAIGSFDESFVNLLHNDGAAQFTLAGSIPTFASGIRDLEIADLNGDGFPDVVALGGSRRCFVSLNDGQGSLLPAANYLLPEVVSHMSIGDADGDGDLDLAIAAEERPSLLLNRGDGTFVEPTSYAAGLRSHDIRLVDLEGDGAVELFLTTRTYDASFLLWYRPACR
jgi:hypothetical protein